MTKGVIVMTGMFLRPTPAVMMTGMIRFVINMITSDDGHDFHAESCDDDDGHAGGSDIGMRETER